MKNEKFEHIDELEINLYLEKHLKLKEVYDNTGGWETIQLLANEYVNPDNIESYIDNNNKSNNSCSSFKGNLEVFKHFERCGFLINAMLMEQIAADIEVYTSKWVMDAATEAMNRGKINYKYVLGILQNWMSKGRSNSDGTRGNSSKDNFTDKDEYDTSRFSDNSQEWDGQDIETEF